MLSAGSVEPVAAILIDAEPLAWLTSMESPCLGDADLDASERIYQFTSVKYSCPDVANMDDPESFS